MNKIPKKFFQKAPKTYYSSEEYKTHVLQESQKNIYIIPCVCNIPKLSQKVTYETWKQYWSDIL